MQNYKKGEKRIHNLVYHNLASKINYSKSKNKRDWELLLMKKKLKGLAN